ncbi:type I-E CRISPR-associated protein Cas5/CasD [Nitrosomonas communis]|uniref:type I-E CRISPR-associated protein Cas5/CasD n=1 Tax=Nitrosomonas communis TaxID=44574 RepID=UPI0026E97BEC|nr:type I-E CRISPR-associated protein Cas5/CasD [Nitrosomonas communis]MCO6428716.1 type I-E CRISPR-associated protein Cas5/CasD [Nitrosomonas communis]
MNYLVFQLQAPFSAWGETAVGEFRPTANYPSESALLGLLAAALGMRREEEDAHAALHRGYSFAIGVLASGCLLRDYHTAQVPGRVSLKNLPHNSRRDELNLPKIDLNTILSTRDYRQGAANMIAVQAHDGAPYALDDLAQVLAKPRFTLYLGRKACPPALPLNPQIIAAENSHTALYNYRQELVKRSGETIPEFERIVWGEGIESGTIHDLEVVRKDRVLSREHWQFGDRIEYVALKPQGGQ